MSGFPFPTPTVVVPKPLESFFFILISGDKDNKKIVKGGKNITLRKRNPNNVWDSKYVTYISKGKLQITPLKFGVDWILHPKVSET